MNSSTCIGVGIDTARYGHHVSFMDEEKRMAGKPFHFTECADGYRKLHKAFDRLFDKYADLHLHIRIDAAGQYAENLLQWVHRLDINATISVGQPAKNEAYRKSHYDKRKADPVESLACARFAVVERPDPTPLNPSEFSQLRDVVALMESSSKQRTRLVNQLHALLSRTFPELAVHAYNLQANWVLTLLEKYPTIEKIAAARIATIEKIPHIKPAVAAKLHAAAKVSTASSSGPIAEQLIEQKVSEIRDQQKAFVKLEKLAKTALDRLPEGPHRRLATIPGIGLQTTAALIAKIVSIDRFATASALIGYFGIFSEELDVSGVDKNGKPKKATSTRMSRKGNDLVRRLLYTASQSAVSCNPAVRCLFARQRNAGKHYNVAIGHCMAKLLRQVFAVWTKDCDFDPNFEQSEATDFPIEEEAAGHKEVEPHKQVVTATAASVPVGSDPIKRPGLDFARLRQQFSIEDVLEHSQWKPDSVRGNQQRGPCPLEAEPTSSRAFCVNVSKNVYHCHCCGQQGNALDLWAAIRGEPILEAGWTLIETLGLKPLPQTKEELTTANK